VGTVDQIRSGVVALGLPAPVDTAIHRIAAVYCVVVEVDCAGSTGLGYLSTFERGQADALSALVRDVAQVALGSDSADVPGTVDRMRLRLDFIGRSGPSVPVVAAVESALWDAHARSLGVPLAHLGGIRHRSIPVYATGGFLALSRAELVAEAAGFRDAGYLGYKIKVGLPDWREDVARVAAVRRCIGPDLALMVDANQGWTPWRARMIGAALAEFDLAWIEEPLDAEDFAGQAQLATELTTPIGAGETVFGVRGIENLIQHHAADVLTIDAAKCGGVVAFRDAATLADRARLPVTSHTFTPLSVQLMAASPTATFIEHVPGWWDPLFDQHPQLTDGHYEIGSAPGIGSALAPEHRQHLIRIEPATAPH
jgi:L-alanine-DL-glutamate epimerase-like enolase superfamily enzyme